MNRFIEMLEKIILAIIGKLNIVIILLLLVVFGVMNTAEVFLWFNAIGTSFKGLLP